MTPCVELIPLVGYVLATLGIDKGNLHNPMGLIIGTAAAESNCVHRVQMEQGPARGLWQMEREDHDDIWVNFLDHRPSLAHKVALLGTEGFRDQKTLFPKFEQLVGNSWYACAMARVHYLRVKEPIPKFDEVAAMALYWKNHYNTEKGAGNPITFHDRYAPIVQHIRAALIGLPAVH